MSNRVRFSNVPDILHLMSGGVNPFSEARERAKLKQNQQKAEISEIAVTVTISVEAIGNNWNRVINRLEREIDRPYPNQTYYLQQIFTPNPACDDWTIILRFESLEDMNVNLERFRDKIERICNDRRA
jgi:hypothetical protein